MSSLTPDSNPYYPELLRRAEDELIKIRRDAAHFNHPPKERSGLALSGGGIRSATFNLGLLQALARARLLRRFDFLSTVSGGGYAGAFFGAWVSRENHDITAVEEALGAPTESKPVRFLRENGRYLAPNGAGDLWAAGSAVLRSWVAMLAVLGLFAFAFFMTAVWLREWLCPDLSIPVSVKGFDVWISPLLVMAAAVGGLAVVPLIVAFWSLGSKIWRVSWLGFAFVALGVLGWAIDAAGPWSQGRPPASDLTVGLVAGSILVAVISWVSANFVSERAVADASVAGGSMTSHRGDIDAGRRQLTDWLAGALALTSILFITGLADTLAASWLLLESPKKLWIAHGALAAVLAAGKYAVSHLDVVTDKKKRPAVPLTVVAGVAAGLIALALYTLLDLWALRIALAFDAHFFYEELPSEAWTLGWIALAVIFVCVLIGRAITFLNLSSHQSLYAARITRSYLGATNPIRQTSPDQDITAPVAGDQIAYRDYRPHAHGGPLHLINSTVNETVSGKSQIEQRDRHGFGLTIGPAAISAGRIHHALLFRPLRAPGAVNAAVVAPRPDEVSDWTHTQLTVFPLPPGPGAYPLFGLIQEPAKSRDLLEQAEAGVVRLGAKMAAPLAAKREAAPVDRVPLEAREMQVLPVGNWIGVSGAAVSTGLGTRTSVALSFLIGLFNVRLGYWWDSGVSPSDRIGARTPPNFSARLTSALAAIFPVQCHLTDELLARFHGPARRRWYLTDGGHFENLAAYELIRRRVPVIVVSDCGGDPDYTFEDVGNLVRLVRTDFDAEIRFLGNDRLKDLISGAAHDLVGAISDLKLSGPGLDEGAPGFAAKHAALAEIVYPGDSRPGSVLLLIKPGVSGDEPADVLNYHAANADFPQQSTADQFFDAAQWESYRKLGEVIGDGLFGREAGLDLEKILEQLRAAPDADGAEKN